MSYITIRFLSRVHLEKWKTGGALKQRKKTKYLVSPALEFVGNGTTLLCIGTRSDSRRASLPFSEPRSTAFFAKLYPKPVKREEAFSAVLCSSFDEKMLSSFDNHSIHAVAAIVDKLAVYMSQSASSSFSATSHWLFVVSTLSSFWYYRFSW